MNSSRIEALDLEPLALVVGQLRLIEDRLYRALGDASPAVDAFLGVDVEHLIVRVEAVDRTHRDAVGETAFAAVVSYHEGHGSSPRYASGPNGGPGF